MKAVMHMADQVKTWWISVTRSTGVKDEYYIQAVNLYAAFRQFSEAFMPFNLVELRISEVKHSEEQKERPGAAVFRENQKA